jgi:hypothetical protein
MVARMTDGVIQLFKLKFKTVIFLTHRTIVFDLFARISFQGKARQGKANIFNVLVLYKENIRMSE